MLCVVATCDVHCEKNRDFCPCLWSHSLAVIGGNDWDTDRERVWSSSTSGELVKALAELFHHCQSPWGLSLSSVQPPTHPPLSLSRSPSLSLSPLLSLSVPPFFSICAIFLSLWSSLCLDLFFVSPFSLHFFSPSRFLLFLCQAVYLFPLLSPSPFFLCICVSFSLSLDCTFQASGSVWAAGWGGIDLTLCCSSHRAVWHSAYACVSVSVAFCGLNPYYCPLLITEKS